jgi:hypothetical protein
VEASTALAPRVPALRHARYALVPTYALASFVAAFLVFQVEPMAAKMVLPLFGGAASVWATALVFFQAVLLLGYLYAHVSVRLLGPRRQALVHAGVLLAAALALPIGRGLSPPEGHSPQLWLLIVLAAAFGAPFFAITSAAPLLQRWLSETAHPAAKDPYFLYAASNAGSLIGLLAYPLLVEPRLSLDRQAAAWSVGYAIFVGLAVCCAAAMFAYARREQREQGSAVSPALGWRTRLRWTAMAFVPSSLLLGVTTHITTDIASVPLVWVVPLAVYLLTFVIAFSRAGARATRVAAMVLPGAVALVIASLLGVFHLPIAGSIALHVTTLALVGVLAHGRLAGERPPADRLTEFYLLLSVGGVLGGCFNALVAPHVFDAVVEYPLVLGLALLLRPARPVVHTRSRRARALRELNIGLVFTCAVLASLAVATEVAGSGRNGQQLALGACTLATLAFARKPVRFAVVASTLLGLFVLSQSSGNVERTFYGVIRVTQGKSERWLIHGSTVHGIQSLDPRYRSQPLSYYGRRGPAGDAFQVLQAEKRFRRVSIVGLGVGSLAAYARPGQTFTFYEIDPAVVRVASDPSLFTYLSGARGSVHVVVGDGRISLQHTRNGTEDMVVLDAFNSDSIPVHLMTREAFRLYLTKLNPNGVLLVHVTNRYLDLAPVVGAIARDLGLHAVTRFHAVDPVRLRIGEQPSQWIALARDRARLGGLERRHWSPLPADPGERAWTDDFSNILSAIKWTD